MAEQDSLSSFDFGKITKPGKFLKFQAGKPVTIRILTKDPVMQQREFTDKKTGEINLRMSLCFIVWNFTDDRAQILSATPSMAKSFQSIAKDEDFGGNLQQCDIKISPEGEGLARSYDINVLRHSGNQKQLTKEMVEEAQTIDLDHDVQDNYGRLSKFEGDGQTAKKAAAQMDDDEAQAAEDARAEEERNKHEDEIAKVTEEPINLDDIPF